MLKEITLKEALTLMEVGTPVYGVNLNQEEPRLFKLQDLFAETRILADFPEEPVSEKKVRCGGRPKGGRKGPTDEEMKEIASGIDGGKIKALKEGKWTTAQIADEFSLPVPTMERVIAVLEQK